jgi:hypothetical protein
MCEKARTNFRDWLATKHSAREGKEDPNENGNFSKWKENFPAHEWNNLE